MFSVFFCKYDILDEIIYLFITTVPTRFYTIPGKYKRMKPSVIMEQVKRKRLVCNNLVREMYRCLDQVLRRSTLNWGALIMSNTKYS